MKTLNCMLQAGPPSLYYYCAVVLHSCIVLPPVGHSSNHQYHCCPLTENRAVIRIFIALLDLLMCLSLVYITVSKYSATVGIHMVT